MKRRDPARPFFLFVSFHAPHEEVASAEKYIKMYAADNKPNRALYYANVTELDFETGRLLRTLDNLGLRNETLVFFTSDNGPEALNRERAPWTARSYGSGGQLRGMKLDTAAAYRDQSLIKIKLNLPIICRKLWLSSRLENILTPVVETGNTVSPRTANCVLTTPLACAGHSG